MLERLAADGYGSSLRLRIGRWIFLWSKAFAHRVQRLNAYAACLSPERNHMPVFLICRGCDQVAEADDPPCAARCAIWRRGRIRDRTRHGRAFWAFAPAAARKAIDDAADSRLGPVGQPCRRRSAVLRHVDFRIDPAEIVTVVGPNGSGKSTLVRALLGHVPPIPAGSSGCPACASAMFRSASISSARCR